MRSKLIDKNYEILNGDIVVATWVNHNLTIINTDLCPYYLTKFGDFETWLSSRAVDSHRPSSRLLKKTFRLINRDDVSTTLSAMALTITDRYWVREVGSHKTYGEIKFKKDDYADIALKYECPTTFPDEQAPYSPELTNIGSFDKCWRLRGGNWFMYKVGNEWQIFSELFTYRLGKALGFNMVEYCIDGDYIVSQDFTNNAAFNFEPMFNLVGDDEDYLITIEALKSISKNPKDIIQKYINIIYLDTLVQNPDRHTFNYGILRNINTGEVVDLSPNFDNNLSLYGYKKPDTLPDKADILIKLFNDVIVQYPEYTSKLPYLTRELLYNILSSFDIDEQDKDFTVELIMKRFSWLNLNNIRATNF